MKRALGLGLLALLVACDVETPDTTTQGATPGTGDCASGAVVVMSDYASTQVGLLDNQGAVLSERFTSSAIAATDGLAFPFSGDLVAPSAPNAAHRVVLVDRYGTNVISWLDLKSTKVLTQLPVGTGFESNPYAYLDLGDGTALVARYGENSAPGKEPFDRGGDVLVLDVSTLGDAKPEPKIVASIELPRADKLPPGPTELVRLPGGAVVVSLDRLSLDFASMGEAQLVVLDPATRTVRETVNVKGKKSCFPALSPDGSQLAVGCVGQVDMKGKPVDLKESGVVLFSTKDNKLTELKRFEASALVGGPVQPTVAYANASTLLFKSQTVVGAPENNVLYALDLTTGDPTKLLEARPDAKGKGKGFVFGGLRCFPGCSTICLLADQDRGVVQRVSIEAGSAPKLLEPVKLGADVGLPPIGLGAF